MAAAANNGGSNGSTYATSTTPTSSKRKSAPSMNEGLVATNVLGALPSSAGSAGTTNLLTLVKYDEPLLVTDKKHKGKSAAAGSGSSQSHRHRQGKLPDINELDNMKGGSNNNTEILNVILPKREFKEDIQSWEMYASTTPATRSDVVQLGRELHKKMLERRARTTGICPVRRDLYSQCFDELIRQVTLNCAERGVLLTHVRNELNMTLKSYQTLYESSIAFGLRKALDAEQGRADLEAKLVALDAEKKNLERQVSELKTKCESVEKRETEWRSHEEKKHADEVSFLKRTNAQLKTQLESILKKN
eukprot:TRINITY_DN18946_c0_g1_i1.p1 TRINITY_DN18946_c0_g1~~TRINITY_DN18946_c0_g1_i1.p1  ORF type:complete len:314 (+),score=94.91 TRINITY_DN18946_c0_g1_i1:29-943(+)